jgi:hypothetical protein
MRREAAAIACRLSVIAMEMSSSPQYDDASCGRKDRDEQRVDNIGLRD